MSATAVNLRTQQHQYAKELMKAGKTIDALSSFKKNLNENGEHIFLLVDIAACYYTLQDHILFKTCLRRQVINNRLELYKKKVKIKKPT